MVVGFFFGRYLAEKTVALTFGALHLEYGMLNPDLAESCLHCPPYAVRLAYLAVGDQHMGRERGYAVSDGPDMDVMDPHDVLHTADHLGDVLRMERDGAQLKEYPQGLLNDADAAHDNDDAHQGAYQGVDEPPAREAYHYCRYDDAPEERVSPIT